MLFVAISSSLMSRFQGHVACQNFTLLRSLRYATLLHIHGRQREGLSPVIIFKKIATYTWTLSLWGIWKLVPCCALLQQWPVCVFFLYLAKQIYAPCKGWSENIKQQMRSYIYIGVHPHTNLISPFHSHLLAMIGARSCLVRPVSLSSWTMNVVV